MRLRRYVPLLLVLPLDVLVIGQIAMQRREVANFTHELGYIVALQPATCASRSGTNRCVREIVEYSVDASRSNRIRSDVAEYPPPVKGSAVEVLVSRSNRYDARIAGLDQYYLSSTINGFICASFTLIAVLATVFPQMNVTRKEVLAGRNHWTWTWTPPPRRQIPK
jgi:hypothetical protein